MLPTTSEEQLVFVTGVAVGAVGVILASASTPVLLRRLLGLQRSSRSHKSSGSSQYYGLRHLVLNLSIPSSSWLNFGYWKEVELSDSTDRTRTSNSFVQACEALARLVANKANLSQNDTVLDVGYGCGDQDIFFMKEFSPRLIIGITSEQPQHEVAMQHVTRHGLQHAVHLLVGDAANVERVVMDYCRNNFNNNSNDDNNNNNSNNSNNHNNNNSNNDDDPLAIQFDKIVCLDSAYHYRPRKLFLQQSYNMLKDGGTIALTDIVLPSTTHDNSNNNSNACRNSSKASWWDSLVMRFVWSQADIPYSNIVPLDQYTRELHRVGFEDVQVECIEQHVWGGFVLFLERHCQYFAQLVPVHHFAGYMLLRRFLLFVLRKRLCHYVVVSARKPQNSTSQETKKIQ